MSILLTPSYTLESPVDDVPAWHSRILYDTIARLDGATISVSTTASGSFASAPVNDFTYEWWQASALPANWEVDAGALQTVNAVGIAVHDMATVGASVKVQKSDDGATWTDIADSEILPADNSPVLILFENTDARYWRVRFTGSGNAPKIGVIYIGKALAMPRPVQWNGHVPGTLNPQIAKRPTMSERGQALGTTIVREGYQASFDINNLNENWIRDIFKPFTVSAWKYGYFMAWRPVDFSDEVMFGWTDDPIVPSNATGGRLPRNGATNTDGRLMNVSWAMRAHGGFENTITPWSG